MTSDTEENDTDKAGKDAVFEIKLEAENPTQIMVTDHDKEAVIQNNQIEVLDSGPDSVTTEPLIDATSSVKPIESGETDSGRVFNLSVFFALCYILAKDNEKSDEKNDDEESQGKCLPKLSSISEVDNGNATDGDDFEKIEPGGTNFPEKSLDNEPTKPDIDLTMVKESPKAEENSSLGMITNAKEDEEPAN